MNSDLGELPKFVPGGYFVQHGNMALYYHFDKPIMNGPDNRFLLSVGPAPNTMYFLGPPPAPARYQLQAFLLSAIREDSKAPGHAMCVPSA